MSSADGACSRFCIIWDDGCKKSTYMIFKCFLAFPFDTGDRIGRLKSLLVTASSQKAVSD